MLRLLGLALIAVLALAPSGARAATITCHGVSDFEYTHKDALPMLRLRLEGEIVPGDAAQLEKLLGRPGFRSPCAEKYAAFRLLELNSEGGSFAEAMKIADLMLRYQTSTYVGPGKRCLSACALLFMAGTRTAGDGYRSAVRVMDFRATVGFHTPFLALDAMDGLPASAVKRLTEASYETAIDAAASLTLLAIRSNWKPSLITAILRTPRDKFFYLDTIGKLGDWNVELAGLDITDYATRDFMTAACINHFFWAASGNSFNGAPGISRSSALDRPSFDDYNNPTRKDFDTTLAGYEFFYRETDEPQGRAVLVSVEFEGPNCQFLLSPDGRSFSDLRNGDRIRPWHVIPGYWRLDDLVP